MWLFYAQVALDVARERQAEARSVTAAARAISDSSDGLPGRGLRAASAAIVAGIGRAIRQTGEATESLATRIEGSPSC